MTLRVDQIEKLRSRLSQLTIATFFIHPVGPRAELTTRGSRIFTGKLSRQRHGDNRRENSAGWICSPQFVGGINVKGVGIPWTGSGLTNLFVDFRRAQLCRRVGATARTVRRFGHDRFPGSEQNRDRHPCRRLRAKGLCSPHRSVHMSGGCPWRS